MMNAATSGSEIQTAVQDDALAYHLPRLRSCFSLRSAIRKYGDMQIKLEDINKSYESLQTNYTNVVRGAS